MEYTLLILLLLIMIWINLRNKISQSQEKTEELLKEIAALRKRLEVGERGVTEDSPEVAVEVKEPEPETLKEPEVFVQPEPVRAIVEPTKNPQPRKVRKPINYEKYIGENLFGKIGILILVLGMGLFVKYAIDKEWINETLRTILGFGVGGLLLFVAWRLKDSYRTFSSLLAGGAFGIFYVTVAIAYHYYGLFSQTVAFVLLVLFAGFMSSLSMFYNRRELAIIALVGGFIAPFLVGSGDGSYWVLFTYVIILDLGMFGLSIYKKWGELPVICFTLTWIVFAGYIYATELDLLGGAQLTHLLIFSIAFYLIFLLSVASIVRINIRGINQYLLGVIGLNNFVFLFFALCLLHNMGLERNYKGLITLFVAAINFALFLWIKRKGEPFTFLMHTLLGIALIFVSVTIPIQLEGTFITLFWASEVMIILWFYSRFRLRVYEIFARILPVLTLGSYGMDVFHGWMEARSVDSSLFINGLFATGIFTGLSYWVDAWLVRPTRISTKGPLLTGCVVLYIAFVFDFYSYIDPSIVSFSYIETFTVAVFFAANVLLGKSYLPVSRNAGGYGLLLGLSLFLFVGMSFWVGYDSDLFIPRFLLWVSLLLIGGHIFILGRYYYKAFDAREKRTHGMTLYICLLSTILLAVGTNNLLNQLGLPDELSAGFSISLSLAGFMQMAVGMRSHLKVVRMISLATFSIVLLKLVLVDLWLLPTIGKVVVFIILGVILLVLSFLYQKLKNALFNDNL
ncbi:DUF2339 domain-containing protein [Parabacteroides sp.]